MGKHLTLTIGIILVLFSILLLTGTIVAQDAEGDSVRGGLLYDKWWNVTGADSPAQDHPLWATQDSNTRSGADTWRCKECHGWDYKGAEGAYGSGSHFTGFAGVWGANDPLAALTGETNADHDFSGVLDEQSLLDLAAFISDTLVDTDALINEDKSSMGDAASGEALYSICIGCHGPDGTTINFGSIDDPDVLGTLSNGNPWEVLHKIRYGQPGWPVMPASVALGLTDENANDILAYLQTLPSEPALSGGGLLYDKWWKVTGADEPTEDHPLWATQDTNERSGADTWRCKECHGWDYKGAEGAYGSGSHFTGFGGVLGAEDALAALTGETHDFSAVMDEATLNALATFITQEIADITPYVNDDKTVNGDADAGATLYNTSCAACHGADGTALNFGSEDEAVYLGTLVHDNPWEVFHKAAFGQPGQPMPAGLALGWTHDDMADLLVYLQTLPTE